MPAPHACIRMTDLPHVKPGAQLGPATLVEGRYTLGRVADTARGRMRGSGEVQA